MDWALIFLPSILFSAPVTCRRLSPGISASWDLSLVFDDGGTPLRYAGVRRGAVEVHLQWHDVETFAGPDGDCPAYRFMVDDPDALFAEYRNAGVTNPGSTVRNTAWGTREFGVYDPNGMALSFYREQ